MSLGSFAVSIALWSWLGALSLAIIVPAAVSLVLATQLSLTRLLAINYRRSGADMVRQVQALQAIHAMLPIRAPLPSMTIDWTIDPVFAETIVSTILSHRPARVFELGSGTSTIVAAYALQRNGGGQLYSVDDNEHYSAITRQNLEQHGLKELARVNFAPLVTTDVDGESYRWYDQSRFEVPNSIDLVIVDGPAGRAGPLARYPAVPLLWPRLSDNVVILLDDASRLHEKEIVTRWCTRFPSLQSRYINTRKGVAVLWRVEQ